MTESCEIVQVCTCKISLKIKCNFLLNALYRSNFNKTIEKQIKYWNRFVEFLFRLLFLPVDINFDVCACVCIFVEPLSIIFISFDFNSYILLCANDAWSKDRKCGGVVPIWMAFSRTHTHCRGQSKQRQTIPVLLMLMMILIGG